MSQASKIIKAYFIVDSMRNTHSIKPNVVFIIYQEPRIDFNKDAVTSEDFI